MATLNLKSIATLVANQAAAIQAQSTALIGQTVRVTARGQSDTERRDSTRVTTKRVPLLATLAKKIDSLSALQDSTAIGSPEYIRLDLELRSVIRSLPNGFGPDSAYFKFELVPEGSGDQRRTPFAIATKKMGVEPRGWLGIHADGVNADWKESDGHYVSISSIRSSFPSMLIHRRPGPASNSGIRFSPIMAWIFAVTS